MPEARQLAHRTELSAAAVESIRHELESIFASKAFAYCFALEKFGRTDALSEVKLVTEVRA